MARGRPVRPQQNNGMDLVDEFFRMGGYAAYIWPAFGVTAALLIGLFVRSRLALKTDQKTLDILQQARRDQRASAGTAKTESDA